MNLRSLRTAPFARVAIPLAVVAIVVAVNQMTIAGRSSRVLGLKVERCTVGGEIVSTATGTRIVRAEILGVGIAKGRPGAVLAPATKVTPGVAEEVAPAEVRVGVRTAGAHRVAVTMTVRNVSDCPIAVSIARVTAAPGLSAAEVFAVDFGGRERVIVQRGARTVGRADVPVERDGMWSIGGSAYVDVGAAS